MVQVKVLHLFFDMEGNGQFIWNGGRGYDTRSFGDPIESYDIYSDKDVDERRTFIGDIFSRIWNDLTGKSSQQREFEQQEYLQDKMNAYNTPSAQMARYKEAGINPLAAASGIAGGGNESAQAPQVATNTQGVSSALGALTSGVEALAGARKVNEEAKNVTPLAKSTIEKNTAEIDKWCHDNDFTDTQRDAIVIDNETRNERNRADLNIKLQSFENMKQEAFKIEAEQQYIKKQYDWYDRQIESEINLEQKRALEAEKHAMEMEENTKQLKFWNDFRDKYKYDPNSPFDNICMMLWSQGRYDDVEKLQQFVYKNKYNEEYFASLGGFDARVETIYDEVFNSVVAKERGEVNFAKYRSFIQQNEYWVKSTIDLLMKSGHGSAAIVERLLNLVLYGAAYAEDRNVSPVEDVKLPYVAPNDSGRSKRFKVQE